MSTAEPTAAVQSSACPECEGAVPFARRPNKGEVVRCADCNAELEVTALAPMTLTLAPEVQEDWGE